MNAKVGAVLLWAAAVWRPSQAAAEAVCGVQAKMLAAMVRLPRRPEDTWLDLHRRRLRQAWRLMAEASDQPHSPFQPRLFKWLVRRHGWIGHALRMRTEVSRALAWRDSEWWRQQQGLPVTGARHPARFHPRRFDTDVAHSWRSLPRRVRGGWQALCLSLQTIATAGGAQCCSICGPSPVMRACFSDTGTSCTHVVVVENMHFQCMLVEICIVLWAVQSCDAPLPSRYSHA